MTVLPDANVLISPMITDHVLTLPARIGSAGYGFATCPITQGSLIRALREGTSAQTAKTAARMLLDHERDQFWTDDTGYHEIDVSSGIAKSPTPISPTWFERTTARHF